jgi:uncharacterized protein
MRKRFIVFCCCFCLLSLNIHAEVANDTAAIAVNQTSLISNQTPSSLAVVTTTGDQKYTIEIPVSGTGDDERKQAFATALIKLLTNLSGNPDIANLKSVKQALKNVDPFVQSYTYVTPAAASSGNQTFLDIHFDQSGVAKLVQSETQVAWSAARQVMLVWLVEAKTTFSQILSDEDSKDDAIVSLHKYADKLGVPIMLPTMDLQDSAIVKAGDVCALNERPIRSGSQRYGVGTILVGCIIRPQSGTGWTSRWLLLTNNSSNTPWFITGTSLDDIMNQALYRVSQNSGKPSSSAAADTLTETVTMRIANVNGLDQYTDVVKYLRTLNPVSQVDLLNLSADEIEVSIDCIGGKQALLTALSAQTKLVPSVATSNTTISASVVDLDYTLADTST